MRTAFRFALIAIFASALASCETTQSTAPQVDPAMTRVAQADGIPPEALAEGRRLLAARCTSCHSLEPIAKNSTDEWRANVREMSQRAGLSEREEQEITAYLVAARKSL